MPLHAARRKDEVKQRSANVYERHGTRARRLQRRRRAPRTQEKTKSNPQKSPLDLGK